MNIKFLSIDKYIKGDETVFLSNSKSKEYISIPQLMIEYGPGVNKSLKMRIPIIHKMIGCIYQSHKSASSITKNPKLNKNKISDEELVKLERYIRMFDIDMIGYTKVKQEMIFKDHKILYDNAIVLIKEMKKEQMSTAPSKQALKEVFRTYYDLGVCVNKIASYLRNKGYNSMAGPAIGGDTNYVALAQSAGLGEIGKHGMLITNADYGVSHRISVIYTDITNLPKSKVNNHTWIKDFCNECNRCINACKANAIYDEAIDKSSIDQKKCATPFANEYGCSGCIKECSFFNGNYEKIKQSFLGTTVKNK